MANGVTSQWEDIHVKMGNYEPRPYVTPQEDIRKENYQKLEEHDILADKNKEELDSLEDELDEEIFREYQQQRLEEMRVLQQMRKFGYLIEIGKQDYVREVTEASKESFVVLHMYQPSNEKCTLLNNILARYAQQYFNVKFIKIVADKCIEDFPDSKCPTILIYKEGKVTSNIQNVDMIYKLTMQGIENMLVEQGIIESKNQDDEDQIEKIKEIKGYTKGRLDFRQDRHDDVSDSDNDDREYSNVRMKKFNFR